MKVKILVGAIFALLETSAMSQSFEGAYGQIGIGYESVTPTLSVDSLNVTGTGVIPGSYPFYSTISNSNSFTGAVGVGYNYVVTKDFLLGIGVEYNPIEGQSANYFGYTALLGPLNGTWKKQNSYNIFISPATPIGNGGLLYGKVGFTGQALKARWAAPLRLQTLQAIHWVSDISNLLLADYMLLARLISQAMVTIPALKLPQLRHTDCRSQPH